jgi:hypothetical protein
VFHSELKRYANETLYTHASRRAQALRLMPKKTIWKKRLNMRPRPPMTIWMPASRAWTVPLSGASSVMNDMAKKAAEEANAHLKAVDD